MLNRKVFYDTVRHGPFPGALTPGQVGGMETLLDTWLRLALSTDLRWLAYILAGVFHETGRRMVPVREGFADSDAEARAIVTKLYVQGIIKQNYARPVDGISYYGRGRIQNTWLANYQKLEKRFNRPFVSNPDLLLDDAIDAEVTLVGHAEGIWTGRKLGDYFNDHGASPYDARAIVNGDKATVHRTTGKRIGDMVADYYSAFLHALQLAEATPLPTPGPAPVPTPAPDVPVEPPAEPVEPDPAPPAPPPLPERKGPLWDAYGALAAYFGDDPPKESKMAGGILAGAAASAVARIFTQIVVDAVTKAATAPTNALKPGQAPDVAIDAATVAGQDPRFKEIVAQVEHATNNEPPIQSRVTQGAALGGTAGVVMVIIGLAKMFGYDWSGYTQELTLLVGGVLAVGGAAWTLYGRWVAKKPVGA